MNKPSESQVDTLDRPADPEARVAVVIPQADRLPIADHFGGLYAAHQVLHRAGEVLRCLSSTLPTVSITLPAAVAKRAASSFNNEGSFGARVRTYFEEAK